MYPLVIFDALRVQLRDAERRTVNDRAVCVALGVTRDGLCDVLGLWISGNVGARFWRSVMNDLKNRGTQHIPIAIVDRLKGFPAVIDAAFPRAMVQSGAPPVRGLISSTGRVPGRPSPCIGHLVRRSLNICSWKPRKAVAATADPAAVELDDFDANWAWKPASIAPAWRRTRQEMIPFSDSDPGIRKIICMTNAIESLNRVIRKSIMTRSLIPEPPQTKMQP